MLSHLATRSLRLRVGASDSSGKLSECIPEAYYDESHAVRAEGARGARCIRLTVLAEAATAVELEYACTLDLKGHFPTAINE